MINLEIVLGYEGSAAQRRLADKMAALLTKTEENWWRERVFLWSSVQAGLAVKAGWKEFSVDVGWYDKAERMAAVTENPQAFWDMCVKAGYIHPELTHRPFHNIGDVFRAALDVVKTQPLTAEEIKKIVRESIEAHQ